MQRFFKKITIFLLCLYGIPLMLLMISNFIIVKKANFKLESNVRSIVLGNSQPECAYNDSLISNFKNLAQSAETYFYNYQKLKKVIEQNPQINYVFIEFNPTNILVREDQKIWENRYINHNIPKYYPFLTLSDNALLGLKNNIAYQRATLKSLQNNVERIAFNRYNFKDSIGGYLYLKKQNINTVSDTLKNSTPKQYVLSDKEISKYDLQYLEKMIDLCKENNISIALLSSPYHKGFVGNIYKTSFNKLREERFGTINFYDFNEFSVDDKDFADSQHLNHMGARKFSQWFNLWLQEHVKEL